MRSTASSADPRGGTSLKPPQTSHACTSGPRKCRSHVTWRRKRVDEHGHHQHGDWSRRAGGCSQQLQRVALSRFQFRQVKLRPPALHAESALEGATLGGTESVRTWKAY